MHRISHGFTLAVVPDYGTSSSSVCNLQATDVIGVSNGPSQHPPAPAEKPSNPAEINEFPENERPYEIPFLPHLTGNYNGRRQTSLARNPCRARAGATFWLRVVMTHSQKGH